MPFSLKSDPAAHNDGPEVGLLEREINVPESEDGKDHKVLDLGTLEVPPVKASESLCLKRMKHRLCRRRGIWFNSPAPQISFGNIFHNSRYNRF